jgi:phosphoribosylformylglycinamidine synthase subunit PurQ / glutaminase
VKPRVLIIHASGTNRDLEAAWACELAGGMPEIVHVNQLRAGGRRLRDYQMLVIPGGFSYGDALGAGKVLSLDLLLHFKADLTDFVAAGWPVIGICNGFQALVKSGFLPASDGAGPATLTFNESGRFECRWVTLLPEPDSACIFTEGLEEPVYCPVAHGEGRFVTDHLGQLATRGQIALRYGADGDTPANGEYPANPNGSDGDIAGICNRAGNVLGLMPHPEDHIVPYQHSGWTRGLSGRLGLRLFENGIRYARKRGG